MSNQKKYWKSEVELNENAAWVEDLTQKEFAQKLPEDVLGNSELPESDT